MTVSVAEVSNRLRLPGSGNARPESIFSWKRSPAVRGLLRLGQAAGLRCVVTLA